MEGLKVDVVGRASGHAAGPCGQCGKRPFPGHTLHILSDRSMHHGGDCHDQLVAEGVTCPWGDWS